MTEDLKPCPFCGGEAERVDIEDGENAGGSFICCTACQASGNLEFGRKENFMANWNRRILSTPDPGDADGWRSFQDRLAQAHVALFHDDPTDIPERRARFFEESNETCQALGMTREEAHALVDYTYDRPAGEPEKEIGAAALTLASVCVTGGYDFAACAEADLAKLQRPETIARIRAKRATRHGRGPLPGFDPAPPASSLREGDADA